MRSLREKEHGKANISSNTTLHDQEGHREGFDNSVDLSLKLLDVLGVSSSSSSGHTDDLIIAVLPCFVFCRLVALTPLTMDLCLLTTWDGTMNAPRLYKVGRAMSLAGSGTNGLGG